VAPGEVVGAAAVVVIDCAALLLPHVVLPLPASVKGEGIAELGGGDADNGEEEESSHLRGV